MNGNYDSNTYLTVNDLNSIENRIENLTNEIQEKIFDNKQSPLRNIQIGDNLGGKILYLFFPTDIYTYIDDYYYPIIADDNMIYTMRNTTSDDSYNIEILYISTQTNTTYTKELYYKKNDENGLQTNVRYMKLPNDFGVVTNISTNNPFYQYIKIYNDETIIPDYEKHVWVDNEILSMQKIENIEHAIKNIGYYYYKPKGWVNTNDWLPISQIENINKNVNVKNISYKDLNRWVTNLNLINFDNLDMMTIWNSTISEIDWNKQNSTEWEEY